MASNNINRKRYNQKLLIQLGFLSAANTGLAFVSQWYVVTQLGPGVETDALFASMTIPQFVLAVISGSLMHVLVPLLSGENDDHIRHNVWGFLVLVGGLFALLAVLFYVAAMWWVPLTVPGFNEFGQTLTILLTRIQLVGMVFRAINGVQWAAYHARQQFLWVEFSPLPVRVFALLLLIWALPRFGVIAVAWISILGMGLQTLLLAPGMGRPTRPDLRSPAIWQAWQRINPLLIGTAYYKTDPLADRFLLSTASSGNLSLYYLAQQMYGAVSQVLNKAIATPLVPVLSLLHKTGDKSGFQWAYYRKLLQVGAISLGGLLIVGFFGQNLLSLLIGHGNISASNVKELWWIMIWLGGMFAGGVVGQISSSSFYALGDTSTPTRLGIYSYTPYIPVKIAMFYYFGIKGLALTTSIFLIVNFLLQNHQLKTKYF